jgi:hypothetical protein
LIVAVAPSTAFVAVVVMLSQWRLRRRKRARAIQR